MRIMKQIKKRMEKIHPFYWISGAFSVLLIAGLIFGSWSINQRITILKYNTDTKINVLSIHLSQLELNFASTTILLGENIAETQSSLSDEIAQEKENVSSIRRQLGNFETEVSQISGTVDTLEKLSKTDPELLQKYSKVFFLNEHYAPERLTLIPDQYDYIEKRDHKLNDSVWPYLRHMIDTANQSGIEIYVFSAYRSFNEQTALKDQYIVTYGAGTANQFSADQGYSEHQLGTTIDLITTGIQGTLKDFETTVAYRWLLDNAHTFGFTLSYPENNSYYVFEPWHWRYVGILLATDLKNSNEYFYDLDQRKIDEYLVSLFD